MPMEAYNFRILTIKCLFNIDSSFSRMRRKLFNSAYGNGLTAFWGSGATLTHTCLVWTVLLLVPVDEPAIYFTLRIRYIHFYIT